MNNPTPLKTLIDEVLAEHFPTLKAEHELVTTGPQPVYELRLKNGRTFKAVLPELEQHLGPPDEVRFTGLGMFGVFHRARWRSACGVFELYNGTKRKS